MNCWHMIKRSKTGNVKYEHNWAHVSMEPISILQASSLYSAIHQLNINNSSKGSLTSLRKMWDSIYYDKVSNNYPSLAHMLCHICIHAEISKNRWNDSLMGAIIWKELCKLYFLYFWWGKYTNFMTSWLFRCKTDPITAIGQLRVILTSHMIPVPPNDDIGGLWRH